MSFQGIELPKRIQRIMVDEALAEYIRKQPIVIEGTPEYLNRREPTLEETLEYVNSFYKEDGILFTKEQLVSYCLATRPEKLCREITNADIDSAWERAGELFSAIERYAIESRKKRI